MTNDLTPHPTPRTTPEHAAFSWGSRSGALPERVRVKVAARLRAAGGDFGRWQRRDRELLAEALSRTEDWVELELEHPRWEQDRAALRAVRRELEGALWS